MPNPEAKRSFRKDTAHMASGLVFSQILLAGITPILSRIFSPEDFGTLSVFIAMATILSILISLRYPFAIVVEKKEGVAAHVFILSLILPLLFSLSILALISFDLHSSPMNLLPSKIVPYAFLIPVAALSITWFSSFSFWCSRRKNFKSQGRAQWISSFAQIGVVFGFFFIGIKSALALILAAICKSIFGILILFKNFNFKNYSFSWKRIVAVARQYRHFPLLSTWSGVLNALSVQLPYLILEFFFTTQIVGFYSISQRLIYTPLQLVSSSISPVFFQRLSSSSPEEQKKLFLKTFFFLLKVSIVPFVLLFLFGPNLMVFILGGAWKEAGIYIQILCPWLLMVLLMLPFTHTMNIYEKHSLNLIFNLGLFVTRALSLIIGGYFQDPKLAIFLFSFSGFALWMWFAFMIFRTLKVSSEDFFKALLWKA